jgi:hypothetical protein
VLEEKAMVQNRPRHYPRLNDAESAGTLDSARIMIVGDDQKHIIERRFKAMGCQVITAGEHAAALECARHQRPKTAIVMFRDSLINVAETVFNLHDVDASMRIIILIDRAGQQGSRLLRQLREHPIAGAEILTRRELHRRIQAGYRMERTL